jgi:hypothetical protein
MFSLTNKDNQPSKIRQTNRNCLIYCASRFGPRFGDFFNIYICDSANTTENNFSSLGYSYEHPVTAFDMSISRSIYVTHLLHIK